jgi:hypothetical protein
MHQAVQRLHPVGANVVAIDQIELLPYRRDAVAELAGELAPHFQEGG